MGNSVRVDCKHCGDQRHYTTGVGMAFPQECLDLMDGKYQFLRHYMQKKTYLKMDALIKSLPQLPFIKTRWEIQECETCDVSYSHYHVSFLYDENLYFSSKEHCSKCDGEVELAQKPLNEYCCLKCGELGLVETEFMDWD